jgi:hypothetical protein
MWVIGNHNLPHATQDTNVAIENYHANLKATLWSFKSRFHKRRIDWVIHALIGDIIVIIGTMHYKKVMALWSIENKSSL